MHFFHLHCENQMANSTKEKKPFTYGLKKVFDHEEIVQEEGGLLLPISPSRGNFEGGQLPKIYESDHCARFEGALNSDPYFEVYQSS